VKPQPPGYNAIISACVKGDQWQQAVDFLEKMQKNKVIPNIISYNTAIAACKVSGESWAAQVSSGLSESSMGIPDQAVYWNKMSEFLNTQLRV
jgi:pentatricopeptide repeat domain-containing protein 1